MKQSAVSASADQTLYADKVVVSAIPGCAILMVNASATSPAAETAFGKTAKFVMETMLVHKPVNPWALLLVRSLVLKIALHTTRVPAAAPANPIAQDLSVGPTPSAVYRVEHANPAPVKTEPALNPPLALRSS